MMKTFLLILQFYFIILITDLTETKEIVASSRRINLFELLNNSTGINLPQFVLLPNIKSENDTFEVKYKTFSKIFTRSTSSKWILSVHVDQHFFYNNKYDEPLHALCYLQFSVERIINHIYKNASCKITFRLNNISAITNCSLKIGKPPSICSAYFDLSEIDFYNHSPTWASISAELYFPPSEIIITTSINQPSFQFNGFNVLNWTLVHADFLGNLTFGLPIVSIKTGTSFKMPLSIDSRRVKFFKIIIEYSSCFSFDYIESLNETRWKIEIENEDDKNKENRFIRFKLHRKNGQIDKLAAERNQEEIESLTFTVNVNVLEKKINRTCWIRAGIRRAITFEDERRTYFVENSFRRKQPPITILIDSDHLPMITFPKPDIASMELHPTFSTVNQIFNQVYTYFLFKSGDLYVPILVKIVTCQSSKISKGISNKDCVPQRFSDSWVLSMQVEQWKAMVFNTFNIWQPEPSKVILSNSELNPIVDWLVFRNQKCVALYQSTYLKVGTRKMEEFALLTFTVSKKQIEDKCWVKPRISKVRTLNDFDDDRLGKSHKPILIPIDLKDFIMITFPEPQTSSVKLQSSINTSRQVYTYSLKRFGDWYMPQLIKNVTCQLNKFSKGIINEGCVPQYFSYSRIPSVHFENWETLIFNIFNFWQPESWRLFLSDFELNPIGNWSVFRQNQCVVLYQFAVLRVGTKYNTFNSFGIRTYLGSSFCDEKPWIDISNEMNISEISISPTGVVSLSKDEKDTILINVTKNLSRTINLFTEKKLFPDTKLTVVSDSWVSVVKIIGKCISHVDINKIESHPSSEGRYLNYQIKLKKLQIGEPCNLFLGVVFNDTTQIWLEDISHQDYHLEVNGREFKNGNLVTYQLQMHIILYGSSLCGNIIVSKGKIDLSSDFTFEKSQEKNLSTKLLNQTMPIVIPTKLLSDKDNNYELKVHINSLSIVIYCVIGVVAITLGILLLNCVIRINVRRHSMADVQGKLSKSGDYERQNKQTRHLNSHKPHQKYYPPPGPLTLSYEPPILINMEYF